MQMFIIISIIGVHVPSQESYRSCICVLGVYQVRRVIVHVFVG